MTNSEISEPLFSYVVRDPVDLTTVWGYSLLGLVAVLLLVVTLKNMYASVTFRNRYHQRKIAIDRDVALAKHLGVIGLAIGALVTLFSRLQLVYDVDAYWSSWSSRFDEMTLLWTCGRELSYVFLAAGGVMFFLSFVQYTILSYLWKSRAARCSPGHKDPPVKDPGTPITGARSIDITPPSAP